MVERGKKKLGTLVGKQMDAVETSRMPIDEISTGSRSECGTIREKIARSTVVVEKSVSSRVSPTGRSTFFGPAVLDRGVIPTWVLFPTASLFDTRPFVPRTVQSGFAGSQQTTSN